jgi:hypothetical protein
MTTPQLPPLFAVLADLAEGAGTIERAQRLTEALKAVPELQRWLRELRQADVNALHDGGMTYLQIAPHIGVKPERASAIARGVSRSSNPGRRRSAEPDGG